MSLVNRVLVPVGVDLVDWAPGFHVYGLAIDNPSGSWLYVNQQWYIPPYTFAWTKPVNGSLNVSVAFVAGPGGIVSANVGGPVDVYAYDYAKPDATGYTTLGPGAITSDLIAAGTIIAGNIADGAVTTPKLDPAGVSLQNPTATVIINSVGITILNGALILEDEFGSTVATGAGFAGGWLDFLGHGFYNATFVGGTTNNITAATIVGTASTPADYAASLSNDVPYWIISARSGAGTLKRVADTNAPSGFALEWNGIVTAEIIQDVPISFPQRPLFTGDLYVALGTGTASMTVGVSYRDKDHAIIGSEEAAGPATLVSGGYQATAFGYTNANTPVNARYARFRLRFVTTGNAIVRLAVLTAAIIGAGGVVMVDGALVSLSSDDSVTGFVLSQIGLMQWTNADDSSGTTLYLRLWPNTGTPPYLLIDNGSGGAADIHLAGALYVGTTTDVRIRRSGTKTLAFDANGVALTAVNVQESNPVPGNSAIGDTASAGTSQRLAHSDHRHGRESAGTPGTSNPGDTANEGTASTVSRSDHRHGREAWAVTSFPASPTTNMRVFRSDLGLEFYYDGTRWLSTILFLTQATTTETSEPYSASTGGIFNAILPNSDIYIVNTILAFRVTSGGSALSGSNKWVVTGVFQEGGPSLSAVIGSIDNGASGVWRKFDVTQNQVVAAGPYTLQITATKTGTPGTLRFRVGIYYRLIAT